MKETFFYSKETEKPKVHFTISKEHKESFLAVCNQYPEIETSFSFQCESTDTIAVTPNNEPFRDEDNNLLFRPGGHGALIKNLNSLDADIVFIKNIDNVSQNHIIPIFEYKKILGGILLELQAQTFSFLTQLEKTDVTESFIDEVANFANKKLNVVLPTDFYKYQTHYKVETLQQVLNKPIRICGMVKNEGNVEVGGFPPFPISYRSIVPKRSEVNNLLVPVCLSASHIAFGSIRMEPVYMVLGQSAAVAAVIAIDNNVAVQDINYNDLATKLEELNQIIKTK